MIGIIYLFKKATNPKEKKYQERLNRIISNLEKKFPVGSKPNMKIRVVSSSSKNAWTGSSSLDDATVNITSSVLDDDTMSDDEIEAIIAHELGHVQYAHSAKLSLLFILSGMAIGFFFPLTAFWFVITAALVLTYPFSMITESNADAYAAKITGNPLALASALNKMDSRKSLGLFDEPGIKVGPFSLLIKILALPFLFLSPHPSTSQRVKSLEAMALKQEAPSAETSTYAQTLGKIAKIDDEHHAKLNPWYSRSNKDEKSGFISKVMNTINGAHLSDGNKRLLFFAASQSKTATAGSGLTNTHASCFFLGRAKNTVLDETRYRMLRHSA